MFSVIFEVHPKQERFDLYLDLAKQLKPILETIDGFIDNERFESVTRPGWILSHSTWRDEKSLIRWRTVAKHHETQERGREEVFEDYHLRVGEIVTDTAPPEHHRVVEHRLEETEIGKGRFATLTEIDPSEGAPQGIDGATLAAHLELESNAPSLINYDVFASIYREGKFALLALWQDRQGAESYQPNRFAGARAVRHRVVRVVRGYGMFDRRESPQYYPGVVRSC
ncbi:antibiotic biosynthesis monooxygenase [Bosea sp. ASV33]|uniref:antibiotic biosynthesis monooxygenase family protein n=1 Tax=Bosea sp. ASV33 TaxID=2795106 RepID=UPI0018ECF292|nr:antibiotic biosynthesis monooxygenase [Bosea sp. ASV33]